MWLFTGRQKRQKDREITGQAESTILHTVPIKQAEDWFLLKWLFWLKPCH